jgi:positive regulator of sigma E activity
VKAPCPESFVLGELGKKVMLFHWHTVPQLMVQCQSTACCGHCAAASELSYCIDRLYFGSEMFVVL